MGRGMEAPQAETEAPNRPPRTLLVVVSLHHGSTERVARVLARVLDAQVKSPGQVRPEELLEYDLVGLGSGIYGERHAEPLLDLGGRLPMADGRRAFIFSTSSMVMTRGAFVLSASTEEERERIAYDHRALRERLMSKGYVVVDEFKCKGWNTNSFLRLFGGMNRGRPSDEDLAAAEAFAEVLKRGKE